MKPSTPARPRLGSKWDGVSPHLLATIFEVRKRDISAWDRVPDGPEIVCPLTEANIEFAMNWQSPFENQSLDATAPFFSAMLQSGGFSPVLSAFSEALKGSGLTEGLGDKIAQANQDLRGAEGRSTITRLNSTQIFSGMPPVKITASLLFRAWDNPAREVEAPLDQLMKWALPQSISNDVSAVVNAAKFAAGSKEFFDAVMPSKAPLMVGMRYKGRTYAPMVIESVGIPIQSPVTNKGEFTELQLPVTLCTLSAIGRDDWTSMRNAT